MSIINNIKKNLVLGIISIAVGLLCLLWFGPARQAKKDVCTESTVGTVTSVSRQSDATNGSYDYSVWVEFEIDGEKYQDHCISSAEVTEGENLTVWYDPADHSTYYVDTVTSPPFMFTLGGVVFTAIGVYMVISSLIKMKKQE